MKNNGWQRAKQILLRYAIPLALGIGLIIYLKVVSRDEPSALLENASFSIASIAVIVAVVSALIARRSLEKTEAALELTRNTTRPFLNVSTPKSIVTQSSMELVICNTGSLPADKVEIFCTLCTMENENVIKEYQLTPWRKEAPSIYFPGDEVGPSYLWSPKEYAFTDDETRKKLRIRVTIDYRNRLTHETYRTSRTFLTAVTNQAYCYQLTPIPREDSWD